MNEERKGFVYVVIVVIAVSLFLIFRSKIPGDIGGLFGWFPKIYHWFLGLSGFDSSINPDYISQNSSEAAKYVMGALEQNFESELTAQKTIAFFLGSTVLTIILWTVLWIFPRLQVFLILLAAGIPAAIMFFTIGIILWSMAFYIPPAGEFGSSSASSSAGVTEITPIKGGGGKVHLDLTGVKTFDARVLQIKASTESFRVKTPSRTDPYIKGVKYDPTLNMEVVACFEIISPDFWFVLDDFPVNQFKVVVLEKHNYDIIEVGFSEEMKFFLRERSTKIDPAQNITIQAKVYYFVGSDDPKLESSQCKSSTDYILERRKSRM